MLDRLSALRTAAGPRTDADGSGRSGPEEEASIAPLSLVGPDRLKLFTRSAGQPDSESNTMAVRSDDPPKQGPAAAAAAADVAYCLRFSFFESTPVAPHASSYHSSYSPVSRFHFCRLRFSPPPPPLHIKPSSASSASTPLPSLPS